ncbi:MAG: single-strand DNA-binding protein [Bacteroidia bacterium]|jgi:single-strand DNA-binding protein
MSINKVILIGNLGSDPEVKYLDGDRAVANFSLATNESYNDKQGNRVTQTEWHRIEMWDGLAKVAEKYLTKGRQVYIEGKIKTDKWTDQNGVDKYTTRIRANVLQMLGSKEDRPDNSSQPNTQETKQPVQDTQPHPQAPAPEPDALDDLPF